MRYDVCEIETHFERDKLLYCAIARRKKKDRNENMKKADTQDKIRNL